MTNPVILVIDQGTSSTKSFIYDKSFRITETKKIRHSIHRPKPGWAESDASEILKACQTLLHSMFQTCKNEFFSPVALGMAFQRSTFLFWDSMSRQPLTPAISWQDTRASELISELKEHKEWIQQTTGIPLSAHFGGPKFLFCIRNNPNLKKKVLNNEAIFGPLSSFVTHALTGNPRIDESIAGRSLLMNLEKLRWDSRLLDLFEVRESCLPHLQPTSGSFGNATINSSTVPLLCVLGDQQASLIGMGQWERGDVAMNFGTSGSVLVSSGRKAMIVPSLLGNVLHSSGKERHFLLEGTINSVSSLFQWLEEYLGIPHSEMNWGDRCSQATRGILVPGHNGLASPYWTTDFDMTFLGFPHDCHPNEYVRAGMESIGFLVNDICDVIHRDAGIEFHNIISSGGASKRPLIQFIADLLNTPVFSSREKDMTALGVATLVARQVRGDTIGESLSKQKELRKFRSKMSPENRRKKIDAWHSALQELQIAIVKPFERGVGK